MQTWFSSTDTAEESGGSADHRLRFLRRCGITLLRKLIILCFLLPLFPHYIVQGIALRRHLSRLIHSSDRVISVFSPLLRMGEPIIRSSLMEEGGEEGPTWPFRRK